jgi:cytochrome c oxidase subunit 2
MFGNPVEINGLGEKKVDEDYVKESILKPQAKIVKGYESAQMPPYTLSDPEIAAIIAYQKSLK